MRYVGRHDQHLAGLYHLHFSIDGDFRFPIQYLHHCIIRGGMFAEPLPLVKRKQRNIAGIFLQERFADYRTQCIGDITETFSIRLSFHYSSLKPSLLIIRHISFFNDILNSFCLADSSHSLEPRRFLQFLKRYFNSFEMVTHSSHEIMKGTDFIASLQYLRLSRLHSS